MKGHISVSSLKRQHDGPKDYVAFTCLLVTIPEEKAAHGSQSSNCSRDSLAMASTSSRPPLSARQMRKLRKKFTRFRILVIGRANAGKTTILQKLCNATGEPTIFDPTGKKVKYMIQVYARY